jgi:hypothetical protein
MSSSSREPLKSKIANEQTENEASSNNGAKILMTPSKPKKRSGAKLMSSIKKKGGKLRRALTPPKDLTVGLAKTPAKTPNRLTLSGKFHNAAQYQLKSCEMDPDPFQVEIPSHSSLLASCKICSIMDDYVDVGGIDFDFSSLMPYGSNSPDVNVLLLGGQLERKEDEDKKDPILAKLQNVASDVVVEGFFREHGDETVGRVECSIFSSESMRQFIVVYSGSSKLQDRPLHGPQKTKGTSKNKGEGKDEEGITGSKRTKLSINEDLHSDVNETVLKAYNDTNLEESIFTLLSRLTGFNPFFDVTIAGHSFGGMLATVAAYKYAKRKPASRIRCHVFGSPKLGGQSFRRDIHSLPNLNIVRVERSTDPFIDLPEYHHQGKEFVHLGHCLRFNPGLLTSLTMSDETRPVDVQLYRFDKYRPSASFVSSSVTQVRNLSKLKIGNEIRSYQKDLEKVLNLNLPWPDSFVGETSGKQVCNGFLA